ncbi:dipeptide ABC transporter ATP-binding protein [Sciscionella marina]|uniref:dipeptide ABC transporter ATP-binding protein n=1 Tax=Sciscionella marina TaxID=508770 RepID=UPI00036301C7|nr:ABC transporter ATP-binding protein [Sciscionella marina]
MSSPARLRESLATAQPVVAVEQLSVGFHGHTVVKDVSFTLKAGRCLAIVGESGSGKSVTARTLLDLNGPGAHTTAHRIELGGQDLTRLRPRAWRRLRGRRVGYVLQDALVSLDPLRRIGAEIAEPLRLHKFGPRVAREQRVLELLSEVGVPEPELRARQLPSQLSGGLRQRALIAAALALDPQVLIADEPTTALDTTVQAQILGLLATAKQRGRTIVLISHDLAVVQHLADEVLVMCAGQIVESGPTTRVIRAPEHPYTQRLIAAIPSAHTKGTRLSGTRPPDVAPTPKPPEDAVLLRAEGISKHYRGPDGRERSVVQEVSFTIRPGETLGIVGESGSGKSTTASIALALTEPDAGSVSFANQPWSEIRERDRRPVRRRISVVYQDPLSSFDPRHTVGRIIGDALAGHGESTVIELLDDVGLPADIAARHPLTLSGGQRQRVAIARALAGRPDLLVFDEPVSALDVSVQAQVLDLLTDLQREHGTAYLFISHDLGVVHHLSDRVLVMKDGRVVEEGTADEVFTAPREPYTKALLAALPERWGEQA